MAPDRPVEVAVALDFGGVGVAKGDFGFLQGCAPFREDDGLQLRRVDPLAAHAEPDVSLDRHAELVASQFPAIALVLTYCGTAALGRKIARITAAPIVLVDPFHTSAADLVKDFLTVCTTMGVDVPLAEAEAASLGRMEQIIGASREIFSSSIGLGADEQDIVDDTIARYIRWLRFVAASVDSSEPSSSGFARAIVPSDRGADSGVLAGLRSLETTLVERPVTLDRSEVRAEVVTSVLEGLLTGRCA